LPGRGIHGYSDSGGRTGLHEALRMNSVAGIVAGFLVIGGAVALYKFGARKAGELRRAIDELRGDSRKPDGEVLDFERDPATGVFRAKP
jgi:hypothetical protein